MKAIGIDLTNALARISGQSASNWFPSVILPIIDKEPIIAGELVKMHRRGSGLAWPPECQVPYGNLEKLGKGRVALADAWRYLSPFDVQDKAWDNYQPYQQSISWQPDSRDPRTRISFSAEELIAQVALAVCPAVRDADRVCLVVPDDLGEGAQQALLDACSGIPNLHLLPRPIAIACHWCEKQDAALFPIKDAKTNQCGFICVLSMGMDRWELSQVEILKENNRLIPVRDHTVHSSGVAVDGLSLLAAYAIASGKSTVESIWYDLMVGDLAENLILKPSLGCSAYGYARAVEKNTAWSGRLKSFAGDKKLVSLDKIEKELIGRWKDQRPQDLKGFFSGKNNGCLAAIADGSLAGLKVDDKSLGQWVLKEFFEEVIALNGEATFKGAEQVAREMAQNEVPYYDQIAPVLIYYQGKNEFNDPIIATKQLIEARRVAAGEIARTTKPIEEFSILEGKDALSLILKREFGKKSEIREVTAELKEKTRNNEPVLITAEIKAGQGFAKAQVVSVNSGLFESMLDFRKMAPCTEPEQPKYAWPPGVANVHSNVNSWELDPFRELCEILSDFNPRRERESLSAITEFRQNITSWIKRDEPYQYDGKIASSDSFKRFVLPEVLQELSQNLGDSIDLAPNNDQLIRLAGWMYEACPRSAIDAAAKRIKTRNEIACDLEVAGKAFVKKEHVKIFVEMFVEKIQELSGDYSDDKNNNWLRAFRDLARFRVNTLRKDFILDTQMSTIEEYVIGLMYYESDRRGPKYNNCLYIAPHLLKRRRFDDHFLSLNSVRWNEWMEVFTKASRVGDGRQKDMAKAMLKVLKAEATLGDIKILARNEGD
jgi:hypothetical protein